MAVTITTILNGALLEVYEIEATADADTTATISHGIGETPLRVTLEPIAAAARTSDWIITTRNATTVTLTKTTGVGSGAAGVQLRVVIDGCHSINR